MLLTSIALIASCLCAILAVRLLDAPARHLGWVDLPHGRKQHQGAIPLTGGVAMVLAISAGLLLLGAAEPHRFLLLTLWLTMLAGLLDDRRSLGAILRLGLQVGLATLVCLVTGVRLESLGSLLGNGAVDLPHGLQLPFTVFAIVGVINAMNMIDGVDGLAGGIALVTITAMAVLAASTGGGAQVDALLVLAAAVCGFLYYNLRTPWRARAAVFMGDAGSTMLGLALGWFLVALSQGPGAAYPPALALWLFALPLMDTVALMVRRAMARRSPFGADRNHIHHRLLDAGRAPGQVSAVLVGIAAVTAALAILAWFAGATEARLFAAFLFLFLLFLVGVHRRLAPVP